MIFFLKLFTGEVGAGKSSAINLLLDFQDDQLLPTNALKCTNTIVEIRSSERKQAVCFCSGTIADGQIRTRAIQLSKSPRDTDCSTYVYCVLVLQIDRFAAKQIVEKIGEYLNLWLCMVRKKTSK